MMATLYLLYVRIAHKPESELMGVRDARIMMIAYLFDNQETISRLHYQMLLKHKNRQHDIDLSYKDINDS